MKELTYFYLANCPFCKKAEKIMEELIQENEEYKQIDIDFVEERREAKRANEYDYFYVPCFFIENEKIFEGAVTKEDVKKVFDRVLQQ